MNIEIRKLANGLTIACQNIPYYKSVALNIMVKAGSRDEEENLRGISHLLEHMLFKGTEKRDAVQIAEEFDNMGGYNNAYTSRESTSYHCKVMDSEWQHAMEILSDITLNSNFPEDEFEREKLVVLQEICENNDNPEDVIADIFQEATFPNQPLSHSILGDAKSVTAITRDQLFAYMNKYYVPTNMVLTVCGNVNVDEVVAEAEKLFIFKNNTPAPALKPAVYRGGMSTRNDDYEQVHLIIGFEGLIYKDEDYYVQHVLSTLLGGSMSSRLFQEVREKRGLAYSIGSSTTAYEETGTFTINVGTTEDKFREVIDVCIAEVGKVMVEGVSEDEIIRSKKQLVSGLVMACENSNYCADEIAKCILTHGRYISNEEVFERINKVTAADVVRLANQLFNTKMSFAAVGKIENTPSFDFTSTNMAA